MVDYVSVEGCKFVQLKLSGTSVLMLNSFKVSVEGCKFVQLKLLGVDANGGRVKLTFQLKDVSLYNWNPQLMLWNLTILFCVSWGFFRNTSNCTKSAEFFENFDFWMDLPTHFSIKKSNLFWFGWFFVSRNVNSLCSLSSFNYLDFRFT